METDEIFAKLVKRQDEMFQKLNDKLDELTASFIELAKLGGRHIELTEKVVKEQSRHANNFETAHKV